MAIVANTYLSFSAKGIREQLADVIYNISPTETPIVGSLNKTKAKNTLYEWQTDSLAATDGSNAQLEGDDIGTFASVTATARVGNYTQISRKLILVSGTLEEVEKAGRDSEIAYQTAMRGAELKRDMETIVASNQGGVAGNSTTARKTASLGAWVKTNVDKDSGGGNPTYTAGVPAAARTDGSTRLLTETIVKSVIQKLWTAGGKPGMVSVGPVNKARFSGFAGIATKTYEMSGRKPSQATIVGAADVYVSDFGTFTVEPNRFQRELDGWFLDFDYLELPHLRPFRKVPLAKTGDAEKIMLINEWGLKVKQEAALGLAADLQTT